MDVHEIGARGALREDCDRAVALPEQGLRTHVERASGSRCSSSAISSSAPFTRHARSSQTWTTVAGRGSTLNIA